VDLTLGLADPGFRVPGLPVFSNPETWVFRCPKTRVIGFIFGQAFMKCSCRTKILHLGARYERKARRSRMV